MPHPKADYCNVKKINRNILFKYLYNREAQSKLDISYALRLSVPTVTQNIRELQALGLVVDTGEFASTGGRRARAIELNYNAKYAIGLDVTKNHLGVVLVDLGCNVIHFVRHRLPFENSGSYFEAMGRHIEQAVQSCGIPADKILGVGIGVPAIVSEDGKRPTYSPVLGSGEYTLENFAQVIPYPCVLLNDANAAGFAEIWNSDKKDNMVYISLSNSVGGSILIDGKICHGNNQRAGEVGHITVRPDGPPCYCGQRGCLDALCSARILADQAEGRLERFFLELEQGKHEQVWEEYLDNMALAINTLRMTLDSEVVLGGYVGSYMEPHIIRLRQKVAARNTFECDGGYLQVCTYKFEAIAVGAALYYISGFIENI